jgi:small-conductance mechanosensitive channel
MNSHASQTLLIVGIGLSWTGMIALAWMGFWYAALFVLLLTLLLFLVLGASRNGRLDKWLAACLTGFIGVWALAFGLAEFHARRFADRVPDWKLMGFHPSFGWIVLLYWLGGTFLLAFGYYLLRHRWLSDSDWQAFVRDVAPPGESHDR